MKRSRVLVVVAMLGAFGVACRGIIGIEDLAVATDGGSEGGTTDVGTDTSTGSDAGSDVDLPGIIARCRAGGPATCRPCCARELPNAVALLKTFARPPSQCACAPDGGAPCSQDCGGVQSVCPGSPAGPTTEAQCEACLVANVTDPRCDSTETACNGSTACKVLLTCVSQCN